MAIVEEPALTMKEAIMEVRSDVKAILDILPRKADRTDLDRLAERVTALEEAHAVEDGVASFKKWIVGLGVTMVLTVLGLVGSIVIKLLPLGGKHGG